LAKVDITSGFAMIIIQIVLAYLGFGVWTLVLGQHTSGLVRSSLLLRASGYRPRLRFSVPELMAIRSMGVNMTATALTRFLDRNLEVLVIGRVLGSHSLGLYTMSMRFSTNLAWRVAPIVGRVMFPAYSRIQTQPALLSKTLNRSVASTAFVVLPAMFGLSALAEPLIFGVLGPEWAASAPVLQALALVASLELLRVVTQPILVALDHAHWQFRLTLASSALRFAALVLGTQFSIAAVAWLLVVAQIVVTAAGLTFCAKLAAVRLTELTRGLMPHVIASGLMSIVVWITAGQLQSLDVPELAIVGFGVALGVVLYLLYSISYRPAALHDALSLLPARLRTPLSRFF
jgi:PST family polysaccharide transporter